MIELMESKPTIVTTYLERPSILTEIVERAGAVLVNFGATDRAILDVILENSTRRENCRLNCHLTGNPYSTKKKTFRLIWKTRSLSLGMG